MSALLQAEGLELAGTLQLGLEERLALQLLADLLRLVLHPAAQGRDPADREQRGQREDRGEGQDARPRPP